nr:MAG TPA: hypothetical protein [Caudoviricetes sp.]
MSSDRPYFFKIVSSMSWHSRRVFASKSMLDPN